MSGSKTTPTPAWSPRTPPESDASAGRSSAAAAVAGLIALLLATAADAVQVDVAADPLEQKAGCSGATAEFCDLRIYQVMVESFVNGDSSINYNAGYGTSHHRGDIRGVIDSLDYIRSLGMNAVWLTPIFDSHAGAPQDRLTGFDAVDLKLDATGYFTRDYFKVDPNFGTLADAQELVAAAHAKGMYVFLDGVFGHHKGSLVTSPTGKLPVDSTNPNDYFGSPSGYPGRVVDYSRPATVDFYKEVATYWIEQIGIDGWRLDQSYQVPPDALREIRAAVEAASAAKGTLGYLVAETWLSDSEINNLSYGPASNPILFSAFDFPLRYAAVEVTAGSEGGTSGSPASTLNASWAYGSHDGYSPHALPNLMLGNHDLVRFGDLLQRANIADPTDAEYWARHRLAFLVQGAYSGPITRYYGEEIGDEVPNYADRVTGGCATQGLCDDHVARTSGRVLGVTLTESQFSTDQLDLIDFHQDLMRIRSQYPALSHGSRQHLYSDSALYVDLKVLGDQEIVFAMNLSDQATTVELHEQLFAADPSAAWDLFADAPVTLNGDYLSLTLAPLSGTYILLADAPLGVGDYDGDGDRDGGDLLLWQRGESPSALSADDLSQWEATFGTAASAATIQQSVPAPTTLALSLAAAAMHYSAARRVRLAPNNACVQRGGV